MSRLTYADIWESDMPWPDGPDVLGTVVRHQRGRAPMTVFTETPEGVRGQIGISMPVFVHPLYGLVNTADVVPVRLYAVLQKRTSLALAQYHDFDTEDILTWARGQEYGSYVQFQIDAKFAAAEHERMLRGDEPFWHYVAHAFGLDPVALPPLATPRSARFWSAQVSEP